LEFFFSEKKKLLWEKCWYWEGAEGRQYFLKPRILTSFLKKSCFSELLNGVHLHSTASQKIDREKTPFSKKEKKPLFTIPEEIVHDNEAQSVNLKFLAFEMV